jgi:PAS domain-containing protein
MMKRSEESERAMIDFMPAMAWRCRSDAFVEFLNRRWLECTGLSPDEALGRGRIAALHPTIRNRDRPLAQAYSPQDNQVRWRPACAAAFGVISTPSCQTYDFDQAG